MMTLYAWQTQERVQDLSVELNKLKHLVSNPKEAISINAFMQTLMRGGFTEIVESNGGKTLSVIIKDDDNSAIHLQDFYIPDLGYINNLRGFLLSANDGRETVEIPVDTNFNISFDRELMSFFQALYEAVIPILANHHEIEIQLYDELVRYEGV